MKPAVYIVIILAICFEANAAPYDRQLQDYPNYIEDGRHCINYLEEGGTARYWCQDEEELTHKADDVGLDPKMQIAMECARLSSVAANIQVGRRTHKDTLSTFMAKVPRYLNKNGVPLDVIEEIKEVAKIVFAFPRRMSPQQMFEDYYSYCVAGLLEPGQIELPSGDIITIDPSNIAI